MGCAQPLGGWGRSRLAGHAPPSPLPFVLCAEMGWAACGHDSGVSSLPALGWVPVTRCLVPAHHTPHGARLWEQAGNSPASRSGLADPSPCLWHELWT